MFNCLYTIPLCNFGIAFSHAICVIVKYFGKLLLKLFGSLNPPQFSIDENYPKENHNLKLPSVTSTIIEAPYWNNRGNPFTNTWPSQKVFLFP